MFVVVTLVLAVLSVVNCTGDFQLEVANSITNCAKSNNISAADLVNLRQAKDKRALKANDGLKCFTKCIIDTHKLISEDGVVNVDRVVEVSVAQGKNEKISRSAAQRCSANAANKNCDDAWNMYTCFNEIH